MPFDLAYLWGQDPRCSRHVHEKHFKWTHAVKNPETCFSFVILIRIYSFLLLLPSDTHTQWEQLLCESERQPLHSSVGFSLHNIHILTYMCIDICVFIYRYTHIYTYIHRIYTFFLALLSTPFKKKRDNCFLSTMCELEFPSTIRGWRKIYIFLTPKDQTFIIAMDLLEKRRPGDFVDFEPSLCRIIWDLRSCSKSIKAIAITMNWNVASTH